MAKQKVNNRYCSQENRINYYKGFGEDKAETVIWCDTETDGINKNEDQILELSAIKYKLIDGQYVEVGCIDQFIKNKKPIPAKITSINHIDELFLCSIGAPEETEAFDTICEFFADCDVFAAYNEPFDYGFIAELYKRNGRVFTPKIRFDAMAMVIELITIYKCRSRKLGDVAKYLGILTGDETLHNSLDDIRLTVKVFETLKSQYEALPKPEDLSCLPTPRILSQWFWENPTANKMKRIYFATDFGKIFFEKFDRSFGTDKTFSIDCLNMEGFIQNALRYMRVDTVEELSHIKFPVLETK